MKKFILASILTSAIALSVTTCFSKDVATFEKLPQSSYSKLCYKGQCALYDDFDNEIVTDFQYDDIILLEDTPYGKV